MRIGLHVKWPKGSLGSAGNVIGDELHGESMCRALREFPGVETCELHAPNHLPAGRLDVMIYLNDTEPDGRFAAKHVLYMQNAYEEGSDTALARAQKIGYDGYAFISNKLLVLHRGAGYRGIFLPFGVDTDLFRPVGKVEKYSHEVSYVGNDIKGEERTFRYLYPAVKFDFGLYGHWPRHHPIKLWKSRPYQRKFGRISRGKIPQEDVPYLYASSKINLNCTARDCVDLDVITLRNYEVLACRGFLITDRVPAAERELAGRAVFTDGGKDLEEKIRHYLARPDERERIAGNGYKYVARNASIRSRMTTLLGYLREIV